ncbi:MAG: hypothetical protein QM723_14640 [Myxococcaceae bacterium]
MVDADARCPTHPDTPASGACARCGTFICPQDTHLIDAAAYCTPCSQRPDVEWVEAYRKTLVGKRSSVEWTMLVGLIPQMLYGGVAVFVAFDNDSERVRSSLVALLMFASAANGLGWFLGKRICRNLHIALMGVWALVLGIGLWGSMGAGAALPTALVLGVASAPLLSTPSKLFFGLPVTRAQVITTYKQLEDNRLARNGLALSILGLFLPPIAVIAILLAGRSRSSG